MGGEGPPSQSGAPMKTKNADQQEFYRTATEAEKNLYKGISGTGSTRKKSEFIAMLKAQKLKNCNAKQDNTQASTQSDAKVGTYLSYWQIAQKEGGLVNREHGIKVATHICSWCEKKGSPATMWDGAAGVVKYLYCELGVSDVQTKARKSILSADVEMDEDCVRMAMQQGVNDGLSPTIPQEHLGKFHCSVQGIPQCKLGDLPQRSFGEPKHAVIAYDASQIASELDAIAFIESHMDHARDASPTGATPNADKALQASATDATLEAENVGAASATDATTNVKASVQVTDVTKRHKNGKPADKTDTPENLIWKECLTLGKKLEGMTNRGVSIVTQAGEDGNEWAWAKSVGLVASLKDDIKESDPLLHAWSSYIRTSTLGNLMKKQGSKETTLAWLESHKSDITKATVKMEPPLEALSNMHQTMLKKIRRSRKSA